MALALAVPALLLTSCASGTSPRDRRLIGQPYANPSALFAREIGMARAAQDKGHWNALRDAAADDATMFAPGPVNARDWLKGRADPADPLTWQPYEVWSSCDGSVAVTHGAYQKASGETGQFMTVWRRKDRDAEYEWVLDQGGALEAPLEKPEFLKAAVASCKAKPGTSPQASAPSDGSWYQVGAAKDATLTWSTRVDPAGRRRFVARTWNGTGYDIVLDETMQAH